MVMLCINTAYAIVWCQDGYLSRLCTMLKLEMAKDMAIVAIECKQETPYPSFQMVPVSMTLSDL